MEKEKQQADERYIVGAVGDWWIDSPPLFQDIEQAMKYYLNDSRKLFTRAPIFIAREIKFSPSYKDGKIVICPEIDTPNGPFYHTLMYEGSDRGFSLGAHKTTEYKTLDKLISSNPNCIGDSNIILSQGLELEVKRGKK